VIVHHVPQRSEEWRALRVGKLCASRAGDMLATIKTGEAAARRDLRLQLVCEKLTGQSQDDDYVSPAMLRGIEKEADAIAAYERHIGGLVMPVGFIAHDDLAAGCSPDGMLDNGGLLEIKCPKTATHLAYLKAGTLPETYRGQITHALWITGAPWLDFVSFDDRLPPGLDFFCIRVSTGVDVPAYELMARQFLREVDAEVEALRLRASGTAA
jgi:hypothetical protein